LKEALPKMVYDILEDKLEHEYRISTSLMLSKVNEEDESDDVKENTLKFGNVQHCDEVLNEKRNYTEKIEQPVLSDSLSEEKRCNDDTLDTVGLGTYYYFVTQVGFLFTIHMLFGDYI